MCGIIYSRQDGAANKTIIKRYGKQRHRGTEGFGFYTPGRNQLVHNTREAGILNQLQRRKDKEILFHHRMPTSTPNVRSGCHPYSTKDHFSHEYIIVHNGIVSNDLQLIQDHQQKGYQYVSKMPNGTFNDSEALAFDIAEAIEGNADSLQARGSIAFIAMQRQHGRNVNLFYGRNLSSPLKEHNSKHEFTLASEGKGKDIPAHTLHQYNYQSRRTTLRPFNIPAAIFYPVPVHSGGSGYYKKTTKKPFIGAELDTLTPEAKERALEYLNYTEYYKPFAIDDAIEDLEALRSMYKHVTNPGFEEQEDTGWVKHEIDIMNQVIDVFEQVEGKRYEIYNL